MTVILGLALTQVASSLHKLLLAGRRVAWAAEPILLTVLVSLIIVMTWLSSWTARNETSVAYWQIFTQILTLLILYFAAASCLPEPDACDERVDIYAYYDRTRVLSFGSLFSAYFIYLANSLLSYGQPKLGFVTLGSVLYLGAYAALIFIRARWFNILALSLATAGIAFGSMGLRVAT